MIYTLDPGLPGNAIGGHFKAPCMVLLSAEVPVRFGLGYQQKAVVAACLPAVHL